MELNVGYNLPVQELYSNKFILQLFTQKKSSNTPIPTPKFFKLKLFQ